MSGDQRLTIARVEHAVARGRPRVAGTIEVDRTRGDLFVWAADGPLEVCEVLLGTELLPGPELTSRLGVSDGDVLR